MKDTYKIARRFLIDRIPTPKPEQVLDSYLKPKITSKEKIDLSDLFQRLLFSAQNANMKARVVGESLGGFDNLGEALYQFDPIRTEKKFYGRPGSLLKHIIKTLKPRGKIRTQPRSIWPKYCQTILSAAHYLNSFSSSDKFYEWANSIYRIKRSMAALPLILSEEIDGIGYPLACDFLKELGFVDYGKPDVHVIEILVGIGLCPDKPGPYHVQKVISQIAESSRVSPYAVDKVLWLIGSGKFYKHKGIGKEGKIGKMKKEFIAKYNRGRTRSGLAF